MKKSAYYSDLLFAFSLTAFLVLFTLRFLGVKLALALPPSLCLGIACSILLSFHLKRKQIIFSLKKSEEREKNDLFLYFCVSPEREVESFFKPRIPLLIDNIEVKESENNHSQNDRLVYQDKRFVYNFTFRELNEDDIAEVAKTLRGDTQIILLCDKLTKEGLALCDKLGFSVLQGNEIYQKLKEKKQLPQNIKFYATTTKTTRRQICFAKNNSKRFFKSGVMLSVFSFFTPYPVYYAVTACLFFLVSVFVRIYGYR